MKFPIFCVVTASLLASGTALAEKERLKISGQALIDGDYYESYWSKDGDSSTTEAQLRNLRLQLDYDFPRNWEGKLQFDVDADEDDEDIDIGSAYMRYTKWKVADITLGRMKEPIGLERNTSSRKLMTIEGAMISTAFTPGKSWGVHFFNANEQRRWAVAAVVEDDQDSRYEEDTPVALSGRFTWSPVNHDDQTLQLGFSGSLRDWNGNTYQVRERGEVGSADNVIRSAEFIAEQQSLLALEGVWRRNSLQFQGEYIRTTVEEENGPDWNYDGYYVTGSYLLTGEQRRFESGEFKSLRPNAQSGAWELVARYSYLDVRERGLGSKAAISTLGVNYYYGRQIKVMLALLHPDISGSVRHADPDGNAISMRFQYKY